MSVPRTSSSHDLDDAEMPRRDGLPRGSTGHLGNRPSLAGSVRRGRFRDRGSARFAGPAKLLAGSTLFLLFTASPTFGGDWETGVGGPARCRPASRS